MKVTKEINISKFNRGITLISLIITIVVMLIITSTTITVSYDRFEINNFNKMENDIELLSDKVENYYLKYNGLPTIKDDTGNFVEYTYTTLEFEKNANDNEKYYILDLSAMEEVALNYGKEGYNNVNSSDDVYIINEKSYQIYYVRGIKVKQAKYHTVSMGKDSVTDAIPPSKPQIKVISGTKNSEGVYTTEVQLEIIPGNEEGSVATKTELSIDGGNTWNELDNKIYTLTDNGTYTVVARSYDKLDNISTSDEIDEITIKYVKVSEAQANTEVFNNKITIFDDRGEAIVVPAGFKVTTDASLVNEGIVIEDANQNQFVWIPVKDINDMVMCQEHGARVTLDTETLKCPTCGNDTKLAGKLYATETGEKFNGALIGQNYVEDSGLREPANLSDAEGGDNESRFSTITWTSTLYQESFDKMVESVAKHGGFYVGRYETSLKDGIVQSKVGQTPMNNINWYKMYENSLTYSTSNSNLGIVSEMIWGCQWDAMLQFILDGKNASHVKANTNVGHAGYKYDEDLGYYIWWTFLNKPYKTRGTDYTEAYYGNSKFPNSLEKYNDKASNIYDLEGNVHEYTQEAYDNNVRICRGGSCAIKSSPSYRGLSNNIPTTTDEDYGSRLSLYIV